jgi:trimeric autotransporter adhesin
MSHSFAIRKLSLGIAITLSAVTWQTAIAAATCPFDNGGSSLAVDGMILARYAQGVTGAPLVANTGIPATSAGTVADSITSEAYDLRITGNAAMTPVDSLIISRKLAGLSGSALTDGLNLGSGSRSTPAAVQSFLLAGCAGTAWVQGGNAFGATGVIGTTDNNAFEIKADNQRVARFEQGTLAGGVQYGPSITLGHPENLAASFPGGATVSGGGATGLPNKALRFAATASGGAGNTASGNSSTVAGGYANTASGNFSTVLGGSANAASGISSSIFGGYNNLASGVTATAGGTQSSAIHLGSFVWADASSANSNYRFPSTADNQFSVRATGGARFVTAIDAAGAPTRTVGIDTNGTLDFGSVTRQNINLWGGGIYGIGVQSGTQYFRTDANAPIGVTSGFSWHLGGVHSDSANAPGAGGTELMRLSSIGNLFVKGSVSGGVLLNTSDRNVKSLIQSINPQAILAKVAAMPISRWVYNADEKKSWHLGPMAQDFRAAFGLGQDDKTIATVDAGGVALAAIQGLHTLVKTKDAKIAALEKANAVMQKKLAAIEKRLGL